MLILALLGGACDCLCPGIVSSNSDGRGDLSLGGGLPPYGVRFLQSAWPNQCVSQVMTLSKLLLAVMLLAQSANSHTRQAGDAQLCIVRGGNFVIGTVVNPPMLCYGTHEPRSTKCEYTFPKPTWKEIVP